MRAVIKFLVGRDAVPMRLVVVDDKPKHIEVQTRDAWGDVSWRPRDTNAGAHVSEEALLAQALIKLAHHVNKHNNGITFDNGEITFDNDAGKPFVCINLGRVNS